MTEAQMNATELIYGIWTRGYALAQGYIDTNGFLTLAGLAELHRLGL